jgi:hypothetical protein
LKLCRWWSHQTNGPCKAQEQETTIARLKKGMEVLAARLQEQATQIQKVNAQLELSKPAARVAGND